MNTTEKRTADDTGEAKGAEMKANGYSSQKPAEPGWYWCLNTVNGDYEPGQLWEAVVRIDREADGLWCSWLAAPGIGARMHESAWSPGCLWLGPIASPFLGGLGRAHL